MRRQKWRLGNCCQRSRRKTRRNLCFGIPGRSVSARRKCQLYLKTKPNCAKRSTEKSLSWVDIMGRNHWCLRQQQFRWKVETEVNVVGCWVKSSKRLGSWLHKAVWLACWLCWRVEWCKQRSDSLGRAMSKRAGWGKNGEEGWRTLILEICQGKQEQKL